MTRQSNKVDWSDYTLRKIDFSVVLLLHVLAIAGLFFLSVESVYLFLGLWLFTGMCGITVGYHRLICHKAFECSAPVRAFHLFAAALAFQRGPLTWAKHHLRHHQSSDQDDDPYFPHNGFWFCHMGWTIFKRNKLPQKRFELPDYIRDNKVNIFFEKYNIPINLLAFLGLYLWGGLPYLLVGGFLRIVFVLHVTWLVNSWAHRFGYRNFETTDKSSNSALIALLAFGEGWHNNHHMYPRSARHGLQFWELDPSFYWIKGLEFFKLAWKVQTINLKQKLVQQNP